MAQASEYRHITLTASGPFDMSCQVTFWLEILILAAILIGAQSSDNGVTIEVVNSQIPVDIGQV